MHATSTDTGESQIFRGDVALVTVPLGVLKSGKLSFHPPLPEWKKQAVRKLGFGLLNKVCAPLAGSQLITCIEIAVCMLAVCTLAVCTIECLIFCRLFYVSKRDFGIPPFTSLDT